MDATCYMCDAQATSREHVPPKCLFPESKDAEKDYRRDLVTVPSCNSHNSGKCADDEFLMVSLGGIVGSNSVGLAHKFTKVNRAIQRSGFRLLNQALSEQKWSTVKASDELGLHIIWGKPDHDRLNRCFDRIVYGIHLAHFGKKFEGQIKHILGFVIDQDPNPREFRSFIRDKVSQELSGKERLGSNREIFSYQFTDPDQFGIYLAHLQFYEGLNVYSAVSPSGRSVPRNPFMEVLTNEIPTVIRLGEQEYHFNRETRDG